MRQGLRDRLRHTGHARGRGASPGRSSLREALIPEPVLRRQGFERAAFVLFLLGAGLAPSVAISNITFGCCLASALVWRWQARGRGESFLGPFRRWTPLHGPIGAFVVLSILSCFFSTLPSRSLPQVKGLGTLFLIALTVGFLRSAADVHLMLDLYRGTALYMIVRGFAEYLRGADNLGDRITGGLSVYMTYAGLLMVLSLALAGRGLSRTRSAPSRAVDLVLGLLGATAVCLSLTRNAYLGLGVGLVALVLMVRPRWAPAVPLLLIAAALVLPSAVRSRAVSSFDPRDPTLRDRVLMWKAGASMIADRPFFGLGPKRVKDLYPVYRLPGYVLPNPGALHNNVVMTAAETGIASALAYLAFVAAFFAHALRRFRRFEGEAERSVVRGSVAAMAALFAAGLFEYNFGDVEVLMATLVVASLPFALPEPRADAPGV